MGMIVVLLAEFCTMHCCTFRGMHAVRLQFSALNGPDFR